MMSIEELSASLAMGCATLGLPIVMTLLMYCFVIGAKGKSGPAPTNGITKAKHSRQADRAVGGSNEATAPEEVQQEAPEETQEEPADEVPEEVAAEYEEEEEPVAVEEAPAMSAADIKRAQKKAKRKQEKAAAAAAAAAAPKEEIVEAEPEVAEPEAVEEEEEEYVVPVAEEVVAEEEEDLAPAVEEEAPMEMPNGDAGAAKEVVEAAASPAPEDDEEDAEETTATAAKSKKSRPSRKQRQKANKQEWNHIPGMAPPLGAAQPSKAAAAPAAPPAPQSTAGVAKAPVANTAPAAPVAEVFDVDDEVFEEDDGFEMSGTDKKKVQAAQRRLKKEQEQQEAAEKAAKELAEKEAAAEEVADDDKEEGEEDGDEEEDGNAKVEAEDVDEAPEGDDEAAAEEEEIAAAEEEDDEVKDEEDNVEEDEDGNGNQEQGEAEEDEEETSQDDEEEDKDEAENAGNEDEDDDPLTTLMVYVSELKKGQVFGRGRANLEMIKEKLPGVDISTRGSDFQIKGPTSKAEKCKKALTELRDKGYCSLQYEDFEESEIDVPCTRYRDLIGPKGAIVKKMRELWNIGITIPEVEGKVNEHQMGKVTIVGNAPDVAKAKEEISNIINYHHSDLLEPDKTHEFIQIEDWQMPFVIGKGGSEIKHVKDQYRVEVYLEKNDPNGKASVIVGDKNKVAGAKAHVQKLLAKYEDRRPKPPPEEDEEQDQWGEEE